MESNRYFEFVYEYDGKTYRVPRVWLELHDIAVKRELLEEIIAKFEKEQKSE